MAMAKDPTNWDERYATKDTPWDSGEPSRELARMLDSGLIKPCRMLELGCGTGTNAVLLAQRGFGVTAIDLVPAAIEQAKAKAAKAGVTIEFQVGDVLNLPPLAGPFELVFDRGVYHGLRMVDLLGFLKTLERVTSSGSLYLTLAGNANEEAPPDRGPPRVHAHDLCKELAPLFDLVQLREFRFDGVVVEGADMRPLAWSALFRRR
jgi:ubiquinone/menaquinone biosynthesis C-methylase UbiE